MGIIPYGEKTDELRNDAYAIISDDDLEDFEGSLIEREEKLEAIEVSLIDLTKHCVSNTKAKMPLLIEAVLSIQK